MGDSREERLRAGLETQERAIATFVGKRITGVVAVTETTGDRTSALVFEFEGGGGAKVDYWAAYADDGSLEFEAIALDAKETGADRA